LAYSFHSHSTAPGKLSVALEVVLTKPRSVRALAFIVVLASLVSSLAQAEDEDPSALATVRLTHPVELARGRASVVSLGIALAPGVRLLEDSPLILSLDAVALSPPHRTLRRRDAVDPRADVPRFEVELRPERAGTPALTAKLTAWVCRGPRCRPVELSVPLPLALAAEAHVHP